MPTFSKKIQELDKLFFYFVHFCKTLQYIWGCVTTFGLLFFYAAATFMTSYK